MIFSIEGHIQKIINDEKLETRRPSGKYKVGKLYAIQPRRGQKGIPDGKIYIGLKIREWKPDLSYLPEDAHFARRWNQYESGYPILEWKAKLEGGYTPEEFEELYEKMYPGWQERWAYNFTFFSKEDLEEIQSSKTTET